MAPPRNLRETAERLKSEGFGHLPVGHSRDRLTFLDLELRRTAKGWCLCDTERGNITHIHSDFDNLADGCAAFYDMLQKTSALLASFSSDEGANHASTALTSHGIAHFRNDLPPVEVDRCNIYRIFVKHGRDLARAKHVLQIS